MRFVDFLKTTVLLSAAAATALAAVTVLAASAKSLSTVALVSVAWWVIAAVLGLRIGRREVSPAIARLLSGARTTTVLPEHRPAAVLINRLWPLLLCSLIAGGLAFLAPQVSGIGAGFAIIWALAWRHQHAAVSAIEERDGIAFYVRRTSPLGPMALERAPGMKVLRPQPSDGVAT